MYRAEKRLNAILNRAKKVGLTGNDLKQLKVVRRIVNDCKENDCSNKRRIAWRLAVTTVMLVAFVCVFYVKNGDGKCLIKMPDYLKYNLLRDPIDCSFCHDIKQVDTQMNLSPDHFEQRYAYSGRPVIVSDGAKNWTALNTFSFQFFRDLYLNPQSHRDCQFFSYKTEFMSLREALNMSEDRANLKPGTKPWYFGWCSCDDEPTTILRQHYSKPYFLPLTSDSVSEDWIFMGTPGPGAHFHVDNVGNPSWQAQIKGKKKWRLSPPAECYYECSELSVVVHPGEIILLDTDVWYHQTFVVSEEISITVGSEYD